MGESKKKSMTQAEKAQVVTSKKHEKKGREEGAQKKVNPIVPKLDEQQVMKTLTPLKAITLYSAAKALGINASAANSIIRSLEGKAILKRIGGYSGNYVYALGEAAPHKA